MKVLTATLILTIALGAVAAAPDVLKELAISRGEAEQEALASFADGAVNPHRFRQIVKALSPEARGALVERALVWTRAYVSSPAFARAYAEYRESVRPEPPESSGSVGEELARRRQERRDEMKEAERQIQQLPPEMRAEAMRAFREAVAALSEAEPEMTAMETEAIEQERQRERADYEAGLARWKEKYPESPRDVVAMRLREFLDASRDVDFAAETIRRNGMIVFAKSEYERKPGDWKLCYRVGEPAVARARAFAQAWLKELETQPAQ